MRVKVSEFEYNGAKKKKTKRKEIKEKGKFTNLIISENGIPFFLPLPTMHKPLTCSLSSFPLHPIPQMEYSHPGYHKIS